MYMIFFIKINSSTIIITMMKPLKKACSSGYAQFIAKLGFLNFFLRIAYKTLLETLDENKKTVQKKLKITYTLS